MRAKGHGEHKTSVRRKTGTPKKAKTGPSAPRAASRPQTAASRKGAPGAKTPKGPPDKPQLARQALAGEIEVLRGEIQKAILAYSARVTSRLDEALRIVKGSRTGSEEPGKKRTKSAKQLIMDLKLKAEKGRPKDLARLDKLSKKLAAVLGPKE
jgi:hypothetical protein